MPRDPSGIWMVRSPSPDLERADSGEVLSNGQAVNSSHPEHRPNMATPNDLRHRDYQLIDLDRTILSSFPHNIDDKSPPSKPNTSENKTKDAYLVKAQARAQHGSAKSSNLVVPDAVAEISDGPRFKDQVASVPADRRPPPNRDPDGTLLAAEEGTHLAAKSHEVSTARRAVPVESPRNNNDNVRAPPSSAAEATVTLKAFDVAAVEDTTTGNSNNNNDIIPNINKNNSNEPAAPSQSNQVYAPKSFPWNTAIVAVAVVVIVIVGIVVGVVSGSGGSGSTSDPSVITFTRSQNITNFINSKSYMGVDLSPNGTSPEELALQWLINDDPLQLNVGAEVDEFRLLQRYSLLTLWFQGNTGTTWDNSTNWLNEDECTWFGITCQSGVVAVVDFYGNGLQGSLSPDLGLLTDLTTFDISLNSVSGSLPSEIGLWTNLKEFSVSFNALTGSLPSEIGLWTNLKEFSVRYNALTGSLPSEIGLWTNLQEFDVSYNALTGSLPSEIGLWTNLQEFDVSDNALTGSLPSEIGLWTNLEWFGVGWNDVTGSLPLEIGLWENLEWFYVNSNALTGTIPATIANWKLIETAKFYNNNFSGSMPNGICEFITGGDDLSADCELPCSCCTVCW